MPSCLLVNGGFSHWSQWTQCSHLCGGGEQVRNRTCNTPYPENGGYPCYGHYTDKQQCNEHFCPGKRTTDLKGMGII